MEAEQALGLQTDGILGATGQNLLAQPQQLARIVLHGGGTVAEQIQAVHQQALQAKFLGKMEDSLAENLHAALDVPRRHLFLKAVGIFADLVLVVKLLHTHQLVGSDAEVSGNDRDQLDRGVDVAALPFQHILAVDLQEARQLVLGDALFLAAQTDLFSDLDKHSLFLLTIIPVLFVFSHRQRNDLPQIVGLNLGLVSRFVPPQCPAFRTAMGEDITPLGVGLGLDGLHRPAAVALAVAGIHVQMQRPQAEGTMVAGAVAERRHLLAAMLTDKSAVVFGKSLTLKLLCQGLASSRFRFFLLYRISRHFASPSCRNVVWGYALSCISRCMQ